jgi:hypothetical protein
MIACFDQFPRGAFDPAADEVIGAAVTFAAGTACEYGEIGAAVRVAVHCSWGGHVSNTYRSASPWTFFFFSIVK